MPFEYFDVTRDRQAKERMLSYTEGQGIVPVIVEAGRVQIGYAGGS